MFEQWQDTMDSGVQTWILLRTGVNQWQTTILHFMVTMVNESWLSANSVSRWGKLLLFTIDDDSYA